MPFFGYHLSVNPVIFASALFASVKNHPELNKWINRFCGIVMSTLGIKLLMVPQ